MNNAEDKKNSVNWLELGLCIFCISWLNGGFFGQFSFVGFYFFIFAFVVWFALAYVKIRYNIVLDNPWLIAYVGLTFISTIPLGSFWNKQTYGAFYLVILYLFASHYTEAEYRRERKIIWIYYIVETAVMAVITAVQCYLNPFLARDIAGGIESKSSGLMVAGFANIYVFVLIIVFITSNISVANNKLLMISMSLILFSCLYFANFATALMIVVVYEILLIALKKPVRIAVVIALALIAFAFLRQYIIDFSTTLSHQEWLSEFIRGKFNDIAATLDGKTNRYGNNTLLMRLDYTKDAIRIFKMHPFFGIYGIPSYQFLRSMIRDHNVWFDMLAFFGVIRIIPFCGLIISWIKRLKNNLTAILPDSVYHVFLIWFILGFFNPVNKTPVHVFLFLMLPLSGELFEQNRKSIINNHFFALKG